MKDAFSYVATQSGPVVPAKTKPIEVMSNIIANMQSKYRKGETGVKFGDLAEKFNRDVNPHKYTTMHDILNKALTEATAYSAGQPLFRLDLGNVVADSAHAKFRMRRHRHDVLVEMLYPNQNGNITIVFNVDDNAMKMYELSLDSEQYIDNFGKTLMACCDECIAETSNMTEESDIFSTDNGYEPLVDADMRGLTSIVNAVMEAEGDGMTDGEVGAMASPVNMESPESYAMDDDVSGAMNSVNAMSDPLSDPLSDPMSGMGGGELGEAESDKSLNFKEEFKKFLKIDTTLKNLDNILASKMSNKLQSSSSGVVLSAEQIRDGLNGIESLSVDQKIDLFCEYYGIGNPMVSEKAMSNFKFGFEHKPCDDALKFESWVNTMPEVCKEIFGQDNTKAADINDVSLSKEPTNELDSMFGADVNPQTPLNSMAVQEPINALSNLGEYSEGADNELNVTSGGEPMNVTSGDESINVTSGDEQMSDPTLELFNDI